MMKKVYVSPEMEIIRFTLKDVLSLSPNDSDLSDVTSHGDSDPTEVDDIFGTGV